MTWLMFAQWLAFTPCGMELPKDGAGWGEFTAQAEQIEVVWIWIPSISVVSGFRGFEPGEVICTGLTIGGQVYFVLGDVNTTVAAIRRANETAKREAR